MEQEGKDIVSNPIALNANQLWLMRWERDERGGGGSWMAHCMEDTGWVWVWVWGIPLPPLPLPPLPLVLPAKPILLVILLLGLTCNVGLLWAIIPAPAPL